MMVVAMVRITFTYYEVAARARATAAVAGDLGLDIPVPHHILSHANTGSPFVPILRCQVPLQRSSSSPPSPVPPSQ
jgi:hypothetical protein